MNSIRCRKSIGVLALALLAACFTAGRASAQEFRGKLTLSGETVWGSVTLPAGEYSIAVDHNRLQGTLVLRGEKKKAILVPERIEHCDTGKETSLFTVPSGGKIVVSSLYIGPLGLVLRYPVPEVEKSTVAQWPQSLHRVQMARAK